MLDYQSQDQELGNEFSVRSFSPKFWSSKSYLLKNRDKFHGSSFELARQCYELWILLYLLHFWLEIEKWEQFRI